MDEAAWVKGDLLGLTIPAHADALKGAGEAYLTEAFRASGALAADNRVSAITEFEEWIGGGTGSKVKLTVRYERPAAGLPTELFVKFSRNFDDVIRDRTKHHMEPEVRLALLSRAPGFPIAVPVCLLADFHQESGTGILITERIPYGSAPVEPHYPKCLDQELPSALEHYRALFKAIARLAGSHRGGRLPDNVTEQFPFDFDAAVAGNPIPPPEKLRAKVDRLAAFAAAYPRLVPGNIASPAFFARFMEEALLFQAHEGAIKRYLHARPEFIALCHWNANIDNAWFWRPADGELACGLMDWGSVGQMSLAMTIWGCLSGAETRMWKDDLDGLLALFAEEFSACGAPPLDIAELKRHLLLYVGMMGLAWLMDAPPRILREIPDLAEIEDRFDPRFLADETARVQLLMMTNFLSLWEEHDTRGAIEAAARHDGGRSVRFS